MRKFALAAAAASLALACQGSTAQVLPDDFDVTSLTWRVRAHEGGGGRVPFVTDQVLAQIAAAPDFTPNWPETVQPDEKGAVKHDALGNGWAATTIEAVADGAVILTGSGFHSVWVNGEPFVGDHYGHGYLSVAIPLRKGANSVIVRAVRQGSLTFRLAPAEGACSMHAADAILPDLREDQLIDSYGAVVVLNHTSAILRGAVLEVGDDKVFPRETVALQPIVPYGLVKPPFRLRQLRQPGAEELDGDGQYELPLLLRSGDTRQELKLSMPIRRGTEVYKVTRLSRIDGSVQYYAVCPPLEFRPDREYALHLSLHGAGVEALGQARAHYPKCDAYTVAATNRRPFGHDWQEWGLIDTLETLQHFTASARIDPDRVYLVGHSMGGHGVWYVGAVYPGKWAAIGPSAGWISFFSYGGGGAPKEAAAPLEALERAKLESDTLSLVQNYAGMPIYAVHGEKDDNVPISEMETMLEQLKPFHQDLHWHVEPGAGHWYDIDKEHPGADCLDYPPRNEFFGRRTRPKMPQDLSFRTQNPAVSSKHYWLQVLTQEVPGKISAVTAKLDPAKPILEVETDNVAGAAFDLSRFFAQPTDVALVVDGDEIAARTDGPIVVEREDGKWGLQTEVEPGRKSPDRCGPFKLAFGNGMVWVYGTHGTPEENAAALAKARYDRQRWWYRANGNVLLLPDTDFEAGRYLGRNVILYGHAGMNTAFSKLLSGCPISVERGKVTVGERVFAGDVCVYFVYPRARADFDSVGVVGGTSVLAMRSAFEPRYFVSGVSLPDYTVFGADVLSKGEGAVLASGYFDNDWCLPKER
jgi:pimeloyl-ACP methyl ester carboxylesterase